MKDRALITSALRGPCGPRLAVEPSFGQGAECAWVTASLAKTAYP